jgi:hypothetical protein
MNEVEGGGNGHLLVSQSFPNLENGPKGTLRENTQMRLEEIKDGSVP